LPPKSNRITTTISAIDANNLLNIYESDIIRIHKRDIQLAKKDSSETNLILKDKINYLMKGLTTNNFNRPKEYFFPYNQAACHNRVHFHV
jgi:hypothetical protein